MLVPASGGSFVPVASPPPVSVSHPPALHLPQKGLSRLDSLTRSLAGSYAGLTRQADKKPLQDLGAALARNECSLNDVVMPPGGVQLLGTPEA